MLVASRPSVFPTASEPRAVVPLRGATFFGSIVSVRTCAWCRGPLPALARRDALTCSKACRQAKSRFRVTPAAATGKPLCFGYADPPYPGLAKRYYNCPEVDHRALIASLVERFPDGWALSTSSKALQYVLSLCPDDVRVCVWNRAPRRSRAYRPRDSWEPLIVRGGRPRLILPSEDIRNTLAASGRQHTHPGALVGMKPAAFCEWMFVQLGALAGDELVDLFPGSGAVGRAWKLYTSSPAAATHEPSCSTNATRRTELAATRRDRPDPTRRTPPAATRRTSRIPTRRGSSTPTRRAGPPRQKEGT
jgi:hypothetical protein